MRSIIFATICAAAFATGANAEQRTAAAGPVNDAVEMCRQAGKFAAKTEASVIDACMASQKFKLKPECKERERNGTCYSRSFWALLGF
ncbi:hypothetical protein [Rhizobium binae]|uniref:hypothetical protein n=1 Tax=Rhizobium binae TaxID=1138190 RepID=UPI001C82BD8D|nr:hypothetical protein [Rhizobium binae]MBX4928701.1 hypothetical protein [Rhizobium binae]